MITVNVPRHLVMEIITTAAMITVCVPRTPCHENHYGGHDNNERCGGECDHNNGWYHHVGYHDNDNDKCWDHDA